MPAEGSITDFKLRAQNLHKSFIQSGLPLKVLDGINLQVGLREFVAIIGPSGCGKTTLLNIFAGLVAADAGEIKLNGTSVQSCRGHIAYMQQKDLLLPWRTVLDNALLGLEIWGVPKREARQRARALLEHFGLAGFERAYPSQLSGGMRQRVALVRTLLLEKPLWLLDEPFGALDALTRSHLHCYLLKAWREFEKAILFVTHDVEEALILADRVYVLTARPAQVKGVMAVDLPRPRSVLEPRFIELKEKLLELLAVEKEVALAGAP